MENDLPSIVVKAGQGDLVAQYLIEYDEEARVLIVDGVRVSTELFRAMVVLPCAQCWLRFERKGDEVTVHQWKQPPPGTQQ